MISAHTSRPRLAGATRRTGRDPAATKRWWHLPMLVLLGAVVVAVPVWGMQRLLQLPIERIALSGEFKNVSRTQIEQLLSPLLGEGFLKVDLHGLQAELQTLPWIYDVTVRRRWPGTLVFELIEQRPIARWGVDSFLNHQGDIFKPNTVLERAELPLLQGPPSTERRLMALYQRMVGELAGLGQILHELHVGERGELTAGLANGTVLVFGRGDIHGKLQRYVLVWAQRLSNSKQRIARVDLRYSNGVAVQFAASGHTEARLAKKNIKLKGVTTHG